MRREVPGPNPTDLGASSSDDAAIREAGAIGNRRLDQESQEKEHERREFLRDHASLGSVILLWLIIMATAGAILSVAIQYLTPFGWLSDEQLSAVQAYVFSGAVVTAIGGYMRKYLD
jgi:hypothetical protein